MFNGIYITKSYGTWFPFKCDCEIEQLWPHGCTYVNAWTPRLDRLQESPYDFVCKEPMSTSDWNGIYKVIEMYR